MITTAELHRTASRQGLRFDQVEKDYIWSSQLLTMLRTAPEYDLVWTEWAAKCEMLL